MRFIDEKIIEGKNYFIRKTAEKKLQRGDSQLITALCLIGVAVILAIIFKGKVSEMFDKTQTGINGQVDTLFSATPGPTPTPTP